MIIDANEDAVKVDNDEDTSVGTMYLSDNKMTITAGDDGIHASGDLIIDSGTYKVSESVEGLEGKSITIKVVISPSMQPMTVSMLPMPMLTKMKFSSL